MKTKRCTNNNGTVKEQLDLRERCLLEYQSRVEVLPILQAIVDEYSQSLLDLEDPEDHLRRRLDGYQRRTDARYCDEFDMLILAAVLYYSVARASMKAAEEHAGRENDTVELERILPVVEQLSCRKRELAKELELRYRFLVGLYGEQPEEQK